MVGWLLGVAGLRAWRLLPACIVLWGPMIVVWRPSRTLARNTQGGLSGKDLCKATGRYRQAVSCSMYGITLFTSAMTKTLLLTGMPAQVKAASGG